MQDTHWVLLDTETNGLKRPIYVVELAAQRMLGWKPQGEPFRRLLNQNADISPEASRVNGYTREILERDGDSPTAVYSDFSEYVHGYPIVSYNLDFDLDRVLRPEWERLGIEPIGEEGFCALKLSQRLIDPVPAGNHKLQTLRQFYCLPERGAHTALGDVDTVADLMQQVLRPLAEQRGIETWKALCAFADSAWYPWRIAFGKFKGRPYHDALEDPDLRDWLEWLADSKKPSSAAMGRWYLEKLEKFGSNVGVAQGPGAPELSGNSGIVPYGAIEMETLRQLVAQARDRLAELGAEYTQEHHAVEVIRTQIFHILRPHYEKRDLLRVVIQYRRQFINTLLLSGEEEAGEAASEYEEAREQTKQEYEEASQQLTEREHLSDEDQRELKTLFKKLVRLFHPDRYEQDPEKQKIYAKLTSELNVARDRGDIATLREIANDPQGFLHRRGLGSLDFEDDAKLSKLRQLYASLQEQILDTLAALSSLRESSDYELYTLSKGRPEFVQEIAEQQAQEIDQELHELAAEADKLAEEIEALTGETDWIIMD